MTCKRMFQPAPVVPASTVGHLAEKYRGAIRRKHLRSHQLDQRIKGWMGRADQTTKIKGIFVRPEQSAEISKRHPALGRLRLVVQRERQRTGCDGAEMRIRLP